MLKETKIATVCKTSPMGALIVPAERPLQPTIDRFSREHNTHSIFLVDQAGLFVGMINNRDLLDWARLQFNIYPKDYKMSVHHIRRLLMAKTIGDLARPESKQMAVRLDDTLEEALLVMTEYELEDIAVLDDSGRIDNDLRLSEVLRFAVQVMQDS